MVRPNSDFHLLAEGYFAGGHFSCHDESVELASNMHDYLKDLSCPDKLLYEIIDEYFGKDSPCEVEIFCEQCECGILLGNKIFFDEESFDEYPDRDLGYDLESQWFCQECR